MGSRRFSSANYLGIKLEDFAALTIEDQKSAEYISPTCSLGKLNRGVKGNNWSSRQNCPRRSTKTKFGHKKSLRDSPFYVPPSKDQEVPVIPQSIDEVDYYFHSQSPPLTEKVFHEALKQNLLKNKQMEPPKALPRSGSSKENLCHVARQTSKESVVTSTPGTQLKTYRNSKEKQLGHEKFHKNPCSGISGIVTLVPPTKRVWAADEVLPSKSLVNRALCHVCHIWSNSKFTLMATVDEVNFIALHNALDSYCLAAPPLERIPLISEILFAPFDGRYYRGKVEKVKILAAEVTVTLIDRGSRVTAKISNCREPCTNIMKSHPMYGIVFESFLEEADSAVKLPMDVIKKLENGVIIEIKTMSKSQWTGNLYVNAGTQRWDKILRQYYFRAKDSSAGDGDTKEIGVQELEVEQPLFTVGHTLKGKPNNVGFSGNEQRSVTLNPFTTSRELFPNKRTIYNLRMSPNLYDGAFVLVNFRWNYRKLCISARLDNDGIENLTASIENYVKTAASLDRVPVVDEVVLAPYDGSYYRAIVKGTMGRAVHVEFLDYGDEARMLFSELIPLSAEIISHPIYSVTLISTDLPKSLPFLDSPDLDEALLAGGYVKVEKMSRLIWQGQLQLMGTDLSWSELVWKVLEAYDLHK